jgi:hypothetical protein
MRHAYEKFLWLYPSSWRVVFGQEMATVFEQASGDHQPRGFLAYIVFLWNEFSGLIAGAFSAWTDEYMLRSERRVTLPFLVSIVAGTVITAFFQWFFYAHVGAHNSVTAPQPDTLQVSSDYVLPLIMAGGVLLFISLFSAAFVWNMRVIGTRAGRLKPIWMPGRAANARTARRDQTLHRNSGRQRRELHRPGR